MTTIGVVVSVFNGAGTLAQALASVATQTRQPDAVVVVDDGSTDGTGSIIRSFEPVLPLEAVRHDSNRGLSAGRTTGIERLGTELVVPLDADDVWLPHHVGLLLEAHSRRPGIVSPMAVAWDPTQNQAIGQLERLQPVPKAQNLEHLVIMNWLFSGSLFSRADYEAVGGHYRFAACEDWDLWLRMARHGVPMTSVAQPSVLYRVHSGNMSADDRCLPNEIEVLQAFIDETPDPRLRTIAHRSLRHRHARLALRSAYDLARSNRSTAARRVAARALAGPNSVMVRGAAMVVAPRTVVRLRDQRRHGNA